MPEGKVKDEGDPGGQNGQRLGTLREIKNGHEIGPNLFFNNGTFNPEERFYFEGDTVEFEPVSSRGGFHYAHVTRRISLGGEAKS